MGVAAVFIPISVALSTFGAANGSCFTGGRYGILGSKEIANVLKHYTVSKIKWISKLLLDNIVNQLEVMSNQVVWKLGQFFDIVHLLCMLV